MSGFFVHLAIGVSLFFIGKYFFKKYFDGNFKGEILLFISCVSFSLLPDVFLGVYYTTYILPFNTVLPYHNLFHIILFIIAVVGLIILNLKPKTTRHPIWIMGFLAIILHFIMDLFVPETGIWI